MSSPAQLRAGMEARDKAAIRAALAPDVVLHSPIIEVSFRGLDEVGDLFDVILDVLGPIAYLAELPGADQGDHRPAASLHRHRGLPEGHGPQARAPSQRPGQRQR